jgi:hypothetical protein
LGVLPLNDETVYTEVQSVAESLGYDLTAVFSLKAAPNHLNGMGHGAPFPICLCRFLKHVIDKTSVCPPPAIQSALSKLSCCSCEDIIIPTKMKMET